MSDPLREEQFAELADAAASNPEWEAIIASEPAFADIEVARKVRLLLLAMQEAHIMVPEGFEERLLMRIRADRTLVDMIDLWLNGIGRVVLELIAVLFAAVPQAPPQRSVQSA
jgi:hypothetical protein